MFRYIYEDEQDIICFDKYFDYIESIRDKLPEDVYEFASDTDRYNLSSDKSLHDSWLNSMLIREENPTHENGKCTTRIEIELLGPSRDRLFLLSYGSVTQYTLNKPEELRKTRRNDLLVHEIRLNDKGEIEHAIEFENDIFFLISSASLQFSEMGVN